MLSKLAFIVIAFAIIAIQGGCQSGFVRNRELANDFAYNNGIRSIDELPKRIEKMHCDTCNREIDACVSYCAVMVNDEFVTENGDIFVESSRYVAVKCYRCKSIE